MATKLLPKYQNAIDSIQLKELAQDGNVVSLLKIVDVAWPGLETKAKTDEGDEKAKEDGIKLGEKTVKALQADYLRVQGTKIEGDENTKKTVARRIDTALTELQKLVSESKKFVQLAKGLEVKEEDAKFVPVKSAFAAQYSAASKRAGDKEDEALKKILTEIDLYDDAKELVTLTKQAKEKIDKKSAFLKSKKALEPDHKKKGLLAGLEEELKKLRDALKKKDTMNFFQNKGFF